MKKNKDKDIYEEKDPLQVEKDILYVRVNSEKIRKNKLWLNIATAIVLGILLLLSLVYGVVYIVNETGNFTISLDPNLQRKSKISISPYSDFSYTSLTLKAKSLDYMDNISGDWIPEDIHENYEGEHSKNNYIAYSFFVKNFSEEATSYETIINITSVIKDVDEAVRVAVYHNDKKTVYAKIAKTTNMPEEGTTIFESSKCVMKNVVSDFEAGKMDKYTVVIWLEGDDPECVDDILGGELKLKMDIHENVTYDKNFFEIKNCKIQKRGNL